MSRLLALSFFAILCSCGSTSGGGFKAVVAYSLVLPSDACIRVRASPEKPAGQTKENSLSLKGRAKSGALRFGVLIGEDWAGTVTVTATLHPTCGETRVLATDVKSALAPTGGKVVTLDFALNEPVRDSGTDGGTDAGVDAGPEDAGVDAGVDAGIDAGSDAGTDAGLPDAGMRSCDGGFAEVPLAPMMGATWFDVAPYAPNSVWLIGAGALFHRNGASWIPAGSSCAGEHHAGWARPDGRLYFGTVGSPLRFTDPGLNPQCTELPGSADAGKVYGMAGHVDAGLTVVYAASLEGTIQRHSDPDDAGLFKEWNVTDAGVTELWTIAGFGESLQFAGGRSNGTNGIILKRDPVTDRWVPEPIAINSIVNDISIVSPTLAFAGTEGRDLFQWDGATWVRVSQNQVGNAIYGLQAFSVSKLYAAGANATVRRWNGVSWSTVGTFPDAGSNGFIARLRGLDACEIWGVGTAGLVFRSE